MQKIGCLGAARIAPKALCDPADGIDGAVLYSVAARDFGRAQKFAQKYKFEKALASYEDVVKDPDVTLVYNPLPINLHAEWTIRALEAGKHVLCEKPFAMNQTEADAMVAAARANGVRLIEAFHYRYHPAFETLMAWLRAGDVGEIQHVDAKFTVTIPNQNGLEIRHLPETGGGAFMDLGCYPLHWVRSVMRAEPTEIHAKAKLTRLGVDETMTAWLRFANGAEAKLKASMARGEKFQARLSIKGAEGRVDFLNPLAPQMGASLVLDRAGETRSIEISPVPTYTHQLVAVLDALETGAPLPTEGEDILSQQAAIDAIYKAAGLEALRYRPGA